MITRLKQLSQIQLDFDKRCKDAEARFVERLADMRKQLDARWKQLDKFEASLKGVADAKAAWRRKLVSKEGELDAIKVSPTLSSHPHQQLTARRRRTRTSPRSFPARASPAGRTRWRCAR